RDFHVTGVQTCALPIYQPHNPTNSGPAPCGPALASVPEPAVTTPGNSGFSGADPAATPQDNQSNRYKVCALDLPPVGPDGCETEIGRASCREGEKCGVE